MNLPCRRLRQWSLTNLCQWRDLHMLLLRHHLVPPVRSPFLLPLAPTRLNYQSASSTIHLLCDNTHLPSLVSVLHHRSYLSVPVKAADIASCACRRKPASIQADQGAPPAPANAVKGSNSPNDLSGAYPHPKPLRSILDQQFIGHATHADVSQLAVGLLEQMLRERLQRR